VIKYISDTKTEIDKLVTERERTTKHIHELMDKIQNIENACEYKEV
jgi:hypothetical protein